LIKRQQEILTRLLESEKALDEREYEERREGETAKDVENRNLIKLEEYKKRKEIESNNCVLLLPALLVIIARWLMLILIRLWL
jgi:predicted acetyltransferase